MAEHTLLCLRCRGRGHLVEKCPSQIWQPEYDWMFSKARMDMDFSSAWASSEHMLCYRCEGLDLLNTLDANPPWYSQSEQRKALEEGSQCVRYLGNVGSIEFWEDCCFCRCLFAMTPNPSSTEQDVLLLPDWTLCRVSGEMGVVMDNDKKRQYASCLVVTLNPSSLSIPFATRVHRGDSMCIMDSDLRQHRTLGGRKVTQNQIDINIVGEWLSRCLKLHGADCAPVLTEELDQVRLIDVQKRQIVKFPGGGCDYVALSYVWGGVAQKSVQLGGDIGELPKTLEDAISFTKTLGKQYLWVDSVCIDQSDEKDKANQINRMWSIYRGAYLTVIALSGTSADAGLSGISRSEAYSQLTCCIKGRRLVGIMPTLSQQTWVCPWSHRAWTLQEAMLSPRCLYFSDHQMYFDCTAMLCCESLDHSRSFAHGLTHSSNPTELGFVTWMTDQIGAGGYRNPLDSPTKRLQHWGMKVTLYTYRDMTYSEDGLRAFEGILQRLGTMYPKGFFHGLPIEDFDWGLVWRSQWPPTRREGFPSWTWAGWKGGVWYGQPLDVTNTRRFSLHLEIYMFKAGKIEQLFKTEPQYSTFQRDIHISARTDPAYRAAQKAPEGLIPSTDQLSMMESYGILLIDAICLHFTLDFSKPQRHIRSGGQYETYVVMIKGIKCFIRIISIDREISGSRDEDETFLLIARDLNRGYIINHLLMVRSELEGNLTLRATALELLVPFNKLEVLQNLKPCRRRILLA